MAEKNKKLDWLIIVIIFLAVIATRVPFVTDYLFAWDSGTVALGTEHYDLAAHEPHPPGYVLYVLAAKLANYVVGDINAVLVWISILSAAGAGIFLYLLGARMYGRKAGLIAALLLIFSKNFWAYSEVAFSYTLQSFFAVLIAYFAYRLAQHPNNLKYLYWGSFLLALGGGFRQDFIIFFIPLWLYITWRYARKYFWRAWLLTAAVCMVWFAGMIAWDGGITEYFTALFDQTDYVAGFSVQEQGFHGFVDNYRLMMLFLSDSLKGISLVIFFAGFLFFPKKLAADIRPKILLLWIIPAAVFYVFVHLGERGYLLTFLPALIMLIAAGLVCFFNELGEILSKNKIGKIIANGFLGLVVLFLVYLSANHFLAEDGFLSTDHLRRQDESTAGKIEYLKTLDPTEINFIDKENYKQLHYYLPVYNIYPSEEEVPADGKLTEDLMIKYPVF